MALPDYAKIELGTALIWGFPGRVGVTHNISLDSLAAAAGRMGAVADLGAQFEDSFLVYFIIETGTAPAAGALYELYLATTDSTSRYPGKVTGSDAAYPATVSANKLQLGPPILFPATADADTILRFNPVIWYPAGRYVVPVVINSTAQALRNNVTDTDHASAVILVPRRRILQDAV